MYQYLSPRERFEVLRAHHITRIPPRLAELLALWSLGYTAPECAALLTIERTTVDSHASRARALVVPPGMTPRHALVQAWAGLHRACCLAHVWGQLDHIGA